MAGASRPRREANDMLPWRNGRRGRLRPGSHLGVQVRILPGVLWPWCTWTAHEVVVLEVRVRLPSVTFDAGQGLCVGRHGRARRTVNPLPPGCGGSTPSWHITTSVTVTETDLVLTQGIPVQIRAGVLGEVGLDPHGSQGGRAVNAATIRLSRLPPTPLLHPCGSLEGTAEWSATGFERRGALTRRGSIPLPSSWSVTRKVREVGC